ncbi:aldehyde dehydrogenase family protein [Escherichia coli]
MLKSWHCWKLSTPANRFCHSLRDDIPGARAPLRSVRRAIRQSVWRSGRPPSDQLAMIVREPVGAIAAIVPWNFPLLLTCGPAALAGGKQA